MHGTKVLALDACECLRPSNTENNIKNPVYKSLQESYDVNVSYKNKSSCKCFSYKNTTAGERKNVLVLENAQGKW